MKGQQQRGDLYTRVLNVKCECGECQNVEKVFDFILEAEGKGS